jgi:nucleotidyltransferase substrate binding protein (TIGR01987 family)
MKLDFSALQKAIHSLNEAIESTSDESFMSSLSEAQQRTMCAGVIQNFEFTYELSWKMLRRQLRAEEGEEDVSVLSRKDLFRLAAQKKILEGPESWFIFHHARNSTSQTYDEKIAKEVYQVAVQFLPKAELLLSALQVRN